jgi:hypothetical protein
MEPDRLGSDIDNLFNPEIDEDLSPREWPHERLVRQHGWNFDFMNGFAWEGSTMHPSTRICVTDTAHLSDFTKNSDVPLRLFEAGLRVFADSLLKYVNGTKNVSSLRFYPPTILTFWSAFEAFVRHTSEMLVVTSRGLPAPIEDFLRELTTSVNRKGHIEKKTRHQPVLSRYTVLLRYGFGLDFDSGNKYWQRLESAKELRDYYTHIEAMKSRSISDTQVLEFMEAVLLAIIWPSATVKKTLLIVHHLYDIWAKLADMTAQHLSTGHVEEPFFHSRHLENAPFMFYCPFKDVDTERFPNSGEDRRRNPR